MGIFDWLGIAKQIPDTINAVGNLYTTDKARIEATKDLESVKQQRGLAQLENNRLQILNRNFFDSGWMSLAGWSAGACLMLFYVPQIIFNDYLWIKLCLEQNKLIPYPMDPSDIMHLLYMMFGFGSYHFAKKKWIG